MDCPQRHSEAKDAVVFPQRHNDTTTLWIARNGSEAKDAAVFPQRHKVTMDCRNGTVKRRARFNSRMDTVVVAHIGKKYTVIPASEMPDLIGKNKYGTIASEKLNH